MTQQEFDVLFDSYWNWLLERHQDGEVMYNRDRPTVNNRKIAEMYSDVMYVREDSPRGERNKPKEIQKFQLQEDFWNLVNDPNVDVNSPTFKSQAVAKKHNVRYFVDFKRAMFIEFLAYVDDVGVDTAV